jgi:LEA14-like dessication related protein
MQTRLAVSLLALAALSLPLVGCNTVGAVQEPTAQVTSVDLKQSTQYGARLDVVVTLSNPNDVPLPITKAQYDVVVEGVGQFSFKDQPHRTIPANGSQVVRLPAAIETDGRELAGVGASASGSITYEPPGEIRKLLTDSRIPLPSVGFSGRDELK